ncbi:hypothetical protein BOTBODRAFT_190525 [Botryobasidium botryosum FD-172 SS1]|uniref:Aerobactin siderophore biosynthesis IucA/IucC N-terminal domain-containing protein n=1 Tax=Botryobasidium botryosum (strain FD-172 SS1) TaxID=930990 RepID=A0A067MEV6_BOTB1|nr:hypothetical protein BOTBODRAFT_190525 [Botryobasidium botryosum FD-172 SS1]
MQSAVLSVNQPERLSSRNAASALHRARLSSFSRVLAAAVDERLFSASLITVTQGSIRIESGDVCAWCLIAPHTRSILQRDHLYLIGLLHHPIRLKDDTIAVLYPPDISDRIFRIIPPSTATDAFPEKLDVNSFVVDICQGSASNTIFDLRLVESDLDSTVLISEAAAAYNARQARMVRVQAESLSSVEHLTYAYLAAGPTPDIGTASPIDWENAVIEGHWTNPWNKSRCAILPIAPIATSDAETLRRPGIAFAAVRRDEVTIRGDYEAYMARILPIDDRIPDEYRPENGWLVVPFHPLQTPNIREKFPNAVVMEGLRVDAFAQLSLRTLCATNQTTCIVSLPNGAGLAEETLAVKVPIGVSVSSAIRTMTPKTCFNGVGLTRVVDKIVRMIPGNKLLFWPEVACVWHHDIDEQIAKYITSVIRTELVPLGERVIVTAPLTDIDPATGTSRCEVAFQLDSQLAKEKFLTVYANELFTVFLPPILGAGFSFEGHMQNVLLRVRPVAQGGDLSERWAFAGFVIRDSGGVRVHPETLREKTGEELDLLPGAVAMNSTKSMSTVYKLANHTLVQCHLHPLIRALGLHHSGIGWHIVRQAFRKHCPKDHEPYTLWMRCSWISMKSPLRMKFDETYYDTHEDYTPNIMLYRGEEWARDCPWWGSEDVVELDE